jgi:hypothetical protein
VLGTLCCFSIMREEIKGSLFSHHNHTAMGLLNLFFNNVIILESLPSYEIPMLCSCCAWSNM